MAGMPPCHACGCGHGLVVDTRWDAHGHRRRRYRCDGCGLIFATLEIPERLASPRAGVPNDPRRALGIVTDDQAEAIGRLVEAFMRPERT
jgi:hypothetical protein